MFDMRVIILKFWKVYFSNMCMGRKIKKEREEGKRERENAQYLGHWIIFSMS